MHKFLLTGALLLFTFFEVKAQIEITLLEDMPTADASYNVYYRAEKTGDFKGIDPGAAGENIVWDLSAIIRDKTDSSRFVDPTIYDTALAKIFTGSNIAEVTEKKIYFYSIAESKGKQFVKLLGSYDTSAIKLSTTLTLIDLPVSYLKPSASTGVDVIQLGPNDRIQEIISKKDTADGWGNITTPFKSFDALRVSSLISKTQNYQTYVTDTWVTQKKVIDTTREYTWWAKGIGKEVFKIKYAGAKGDTITDISWYTGKKPLVITANTYSLSESSVQIGPNPSNGNIVISMNDLSVKGCRLSLQDLLGKEKYTGIISENNSSYDFSNLPDGIYLLKISTPDGKSLSKKIAFKK